MSTKIAWTDETWNFLGGCTPVSTGCANCAAARSAEECTKHWGNKKYEGLTKNGKWTGEIRFFPDELEKPLHWKKPRMIFPAFMSDLFHKDVPFEFIDKVMAVMALCPQHKFQVLTKRADRMLKYYKEIPLHAENIAKAAMSYLFEDADFIYDSLIETFKNYKSKPLNNLYKGVSVENQKAADERIPLLLQIPAAKRFISFEPLLENLKFDISNLKSLNWIIIGCESGPKRRPCKIEWVRSLVEQAKSAGVKVFVKQLDINGKVSHDMNEWPKDLRIQEKL
jgi:protein gp37